MARLPLIAGNWKMNGRNADGVALAKAIIARSQAAIRKIDVLVCPPATLITAVAQAAAGSGLKIGGQDCHARSSGAHTGDIAAEMLADCGASYVIVGHSERRADHKESDAEIAAKAQAAWRAGLVAVICIGETLAQRDAGQTLAVLASQLGGSVPKEATAANCVVAYEPVWAIGTGRTPSLEDIAAAHRHIRSNLAGSGLPADGIRLLYGGSVKPDNARQILALEDVDGALVGGASLKAEDFGTIIAAVQGV